MEKDWIELLSLFDQYGARYLIVGGYAVMFYTQPRGTKDLDLFIDSSHAKVDFHDAWKRRSDTVEEGVPVHYIGAEDLRANKLFVARHRDLADVEAMRAAKVAVTSNRKSDKG